MKNILKPWFYQPKSSPKNWWWLRTAVYWENSHQSVAVVVSDRNQVSEYSNCRGSYYPVMNFKI